MIKRLPLRRIFRACTLHQNLSYKSCFGKSTPYRKSSSLFPSIRSMCSLGVNDFHIAADETLDRILDMLGPIEDSVDDVDIIYSVRVSCFGIFAYLTSHAARSNHDQSRKQRKLGNQ
jgi:hypothetical protein